MKTPESHTRRLAETIKGSLNQRPKAQRMIKSIKPDTPLDQTQRADRAVKMILHGQFEILLANLDGARTHQDPECLHDLRVATRRIRSLLTQIKGVFPDDLVESYRSRFAWVQQITNPLRDLDVYLRDFDAYQQRLPELLQRDLEPLRVYLLAIQEREQTRLVAALDSDPFTRLIQDCQTFVAAPLPDVSRTTNGMRPIKDLADERIWHLVRRVRRTGRAIRADSPPEELHELRKSSKKLRYLMEFFQGLYPDHDISRLIRRLKILLDHLGGCQDLAVQVSHLNELARQMRDAGQARTETLLAMGALIGHLLERQQCMRDDFAAVFDSYLDEDQQSLFGTLFGPR